MRTHRLTYANVVSTLALVVALGAGGAFAATQLPKNSVGAKQIKSNAVQSAKIKKDAVTGDKVKNGSISAADLAAGTIKSPTVTRKVGFEDLATGESGVSVLSVPGVISVTADCFDGGTGTVGLNVNFENLTGQTVRFTEQFAATEPALDSLSGGTVSAGGGTTVNFAASGSLAVPHVVSFHFMNDAAGTQVNVDALTRPQAVNGCTVQAEVVRTP